MNVEFTRSFEKQLDRITNARLKDEIAKVVREVISAKSLQTVYFASVAHRNEIYKLFP